MKKFLQNILLASNLLVAGDAEQKLEPTLKFSGSISETACALINTAFLNRKIPDKTNWIRSTIDINADAFLGEKGQAIDFHATLRHKAYWGADAIRSEKEEVFIGNALAGNHSHAVAKPALWLYSGWLDFNLNALAHEQNGRTGARFKIGYFPFSLGRGIALGEGYGVGQDFLGINIRSNDFLMPGILLSGNIEDINLSAELYFARPEAKSASTGQTLALSKEHLIDRKTLPFGGSFNDDNLLAIQLCWKPSCQNLNSMEIKPYAMLYAGNDRKLEMYADNQTDLITTGLNIEWKNEKFEFGCEAAANFGRQKMMRIDRNKIVLEVGELEGDHVEKFSHIMLETDATNSSVPATKALLGELAKNQHRDGLPFTVGGQTYISKPNRIRSDYTNTYRGKMLVADGSYTTTAMPGKISLCLGFVEGDSNPHSKEEDKDFHGFIGINEIYGGKRVPSMIMLDGATVKRPLALDSDTNTNLKDFLTGSTTDINFVGSGFAVQPKELCAYKVAIAGNLLTFFKNYPGKKIIINGSGQAQASSQSARSHLGTEINIALQAEPLAGCKIGLKAAYFWPGSYYQDIKNANLADATAKRLTMLDTDGIFSANKSDYKMSTDNCYLISLDMGFKF